MDKLVVSEVFKKLGENHVLKGVSFELRRGEIGLPPHWREAGSHQHPDDQRFSNSGHARFSMEVNVPARQQSSFAARAPYPNR